MLLSNKKSSLLKLKTKINLKVNLNQKSTKIKLNQKFYLKAVTYQIFSVVYNKGEEKAWMIVKL